MVFDSLNSPKYRGFYEIDKIIQFVKEKELFRR